MGKPRRKRSERKKPDPRPVAPAAAPWEPGPADVSPLACPSSVEFLAAYNAYFDNYPGWLDVPPLQAMCWREKAIAGWLA